MASFRPAGLSEEEDSDDSDGFESSYIKKLKPCSKTYQASVVPPAVETSSGAIVRRIGRGRGVPRVPWEEEDTSIGESTKKDDWTNGSQNTNTANSTFPSTSFQYTKNPNHPINNPELNLIPNIYRIKAENSYKNLKTAWDNVVGDAELSKLLESTFTTSENPFALGLFLMLRSPDFNHPHRSKTLASTVIAELKIYVEKHKLSSHPFLHRHLQKVAFRIIMQQKKNNLIKLVFDVFRLVDIQDHICMSIKAYCTEGQYKEACTAAIALELYNFEVHDFLIPLVLQDRINFVEEYFQNEKSKDIQRQLLCTLDDITSGRDVTNVLYSYMEEHKVVKTDIKFDRLNGKYLSKLIKRLATKYEIDPSTFPNVRNRQKFGELRHLFHRRYSDDSDMKDENFHEFLVDFVQGDSYLMEESLYLMKFYGDYPAAVKFCKMINLPHDKIPGDILEIITGKKVQAMDIVEECWDDDVPIANVTAAGPISSEVNVDENQMNTDWWCWKPNTSSKIYYEMPISSEKIVIVSSLHDMHEFCNYMKLQQEANPDVVAGFDSEWKPVHSKSASLLQIAFKDKVFLIDLMAFDETDETDGKTFFDLVLTSFFANKNILKVAYDIKNDIKMLAAVRPSWKNISTDMKSALDLRVVKAEIVKQNCSFFGTSEFNGGGLSELVQLCLNKSLSKGEQFSDWEKRPLRQSQVTYAAADAYCLLEIFEYIKEREKKVGLKPMGLDSIIKNCQNRHRETTRKLKAPIEIVSKVIPFMRKTSLEGNETAFSTQIQARHVKFVCDNMLQGLGKNLRNCGLDTIILDRNVLNSEDSMIQQAKYQGKFFLTRSRNRYNEFVEQFPPGHVFYVSTDQTVDQLNEIMEHFNVLADERDSFSICQQCNQRKFIQVSKGFMRNLLDRKGFRHSKVLTKNALENFKQRTPNEMISYIPNVERHWIICPQSDIKILHPQTEPSRQIPIAFCSDTDAAVDLNKIPAHLIDEIDEFYVCSDCGTTYWNSKNLEEILFTEPSEEESSLDVKTFQNNVQ